MQNVQFDKENPNHKWTEANRLARLEQSIGFLSFYSSLQEHENQVHFVGNEVNGEIVIDQEKTDALRRLKEINKERADLIKLIIS
jgi:hypothetical protein